jgi:hypothetical protein
MVVNRDRMLHSRFDQFFLGVRRKRDGTVHFARKFPAVDVFARHDALLDSIGLSFLPRHGWRRVGKTFRALKAQ